MTPPPSATATRPDIDPNIASQLRGVIGLLSRRLRPTAAGAAAGLTPTRASILLRIVREGPLRISELAGTEGINPTMLSRVISQLSADGLLERSSDAGDRRAGWVGATASGRRLAERMRKERTDALSLALASLSDTEARRLEQALPALEHLAEALREDGR